LAAGNSSGAPIRIAAPAGTPNEIVDKLNAEINEAMKTPELIAAMAKLGLRAAALVATGLCGVSRRRDAALAAAGEGRRHQAGVGCRAIIGFSSAGHHVNRERPLGSVRFHKN
jgi:hypothetical protein